MHYRYPFVLQWPLQPSIAESHSLNHPPLPRFLQAVLPPVPLTTEGNHSVVSPYETYPGVASSIHNSETPELYSTHPFRYYTLARSLKHIQTRVQPMRETRDIAPSLFCFDQNSTRATCANAKANSGWNQGVMNAALLGRASVAASMVLSRATAAPAVGYRFPGFASHNQDYEPSEDALVNMNTALQLMLLSPADDGLEAGGALLFPAWPCAWDVDFKMAAPRNTVVSGRLVNGTLHDFAVHPAERKDAITVMPCQK